MAGNQSGNGVGRGFSRRLISVMPIFGWLPGYKSAWLWPDLIAGLTLAAYAVPMAMAYSSLAGLAPQAGINCYIFGGLVFALFTSSRQLAVGPTAAISVMVASVGGVIAAGNPASQATIAALTAGMVALICVVAWLLRLSAFVSFVSESILLGFKAGAALSIAATQLPKLFGVPDGGDHLFGRLSNIVHQLGNTNITVLGIGVVAILILALGEELLPGRPVALFVVILAIIISSWTGLAGYGVRVVGNLPPGLPKLGVPVVAFGQMEELIGLAFACFLLSYIESISAARTIALKHQYTVDPRQELLSLGAANLMAAFGQGYPVAGGLSQSAVNDESGARTPLSLVFASVTLMLVLMFLTDVLRSLPEVVLAAIVIVAVSGFVRISDFRRLLRVSRLEFQVAMVALVGVLLFGILKGVMFSVVASLVFLLRLIANPHVAILGRIPGSRRFSDITRHTDNELTPGLLIFRVEAVLLYFNVENIDRMVLNQVHAASTPVRMVVCDLSTSPYIDAAGARMLDRLQKQLANEDIRFTIAEAHAEVRDILRATGVDESLGGVNRFTSVADVVDDFDGIISAADRPGAW